MSASGQQLGEYLLLERIGEGPGTVTYSGLDRRDGRRVVVRQAVEGTTGTAALRREAALLASLRQDSFVHLLDSGEQDGRAFSVLAQEDGITLDRLPAAWRAAMGQRTLLELLGPLLESLGAMHRAGYLHGDISPRNILLRRDGLPLLLDFAAAVELNDESDGNAEAAATPGFTAPERGVPARQGPATDLYALAAVVYWLIVGRPLPGPASDRDLLAALTGGDKRYSPGFLRAVDAALAPAIEGRPASAADWCTALFDADPAERADAPTLLQLSDALREADGIDLPPADEVPPTALLPVEERRRAASGPLLRSPPGAMLASPTDRHRTGRAVALAALLLVLGAGGAAAGWWGWTWYRDATKQVWLVDPQGGGDTKTLAEAIARAPGGATIRVSPGIYQESLAIDRPLDLAPVDGSDGEVVINPANGRCILWDVPSGSLSGFAFEGGDGSGPCIEIQSGAVEIVGNRIGPWSGAGLSVRNGAAPLIRENRFVDIDGSAVVVGAGGSGGIVENNEIERTTKSAIKVRAGSDPTVRANRITEAGQAGLLIEQGASGLFTENEIVASAGSGIEVRGGAAPTVSSNRVEDSAQAGIFIHEGASGEYLDNLILRSRLSGIIVTGGATPVLTNNEITEGEQHGLVVVGCSGGRITGNRILDNKGHGVVLGGGQEAELDQNALESNRKPQLRRLTQ